MPKKYTKTYHIIFDATEVEKRLLDSEEFVVKLLLELPKLISMKILSGPSVVRDYDRGHEGVSGFAIIDFSHISIHTFVNTQEAFIDIFSCRPFDQERVRRYLYRKLRVRKENVKTFEVTYPGER